jgi:hypothetical protein
MGSLHTLSGMVLSCDKCGTTDFAVAGRAFDLALICPACVLVMCSACASRDDSEAIALLRCYNCRSRDLREAPTWADRLSWRGRGSPRS